MPIRILDFGEVDALRSQAIYHGVAYALREDHLDTITITRPTEPYVCIGHHQDAKTEVDLDYCIAEGIPVFRREVGGGAVYLDRGQTFWHTIFHRRRAPKSLAAVYERFLKGPVAALNKMGIEAVHRPVNDIQVAGRKIGGTGAATMNEALVVAGSLLFDFNYELMVRVLRVPSEKFRDKLYKTMTEYLTTIHRELGTDAPSEDDAVRILLESFAESLGEELIFDQPRDDEWESIEDQARRIASPDWLLLDGLKPAGGSVKVAEGVDVHEGMHKAPGGLIRCTVAVRDGRVEGLVISGDFFIEPPEALWELQETLVGVPWRRDDLRAAIERQLRGVDSPGIAPEHVLAAMLPE